MLSNDDLKKIRAVVREEVEEEVDSLKTELSMSDIRTRAEIDEVKGGVKDLKIQMKKMHKDLRGEVKYVGHILDKDNIKTLQRVKRIEPHLGSSQK